MTIEVLFQIVEALAVVIGVGFAIVQMRQYRHDKHREGAIELLHSFQTPSFAKALTIVYNMPEGLSKREVEEYVGDDFHFVYAMITTWESLGILLHRGEVDLQLIDDFFSGPILVSWRKLEGYVLGERAQVGRDTINEWFQWLKERLEEAESDEPPVPAHIEHKNWKPRNKD